MEKCAHFVFFCKCLGHTINCNETEEAAQGKSMESIQSRATDRNTASTLNTQSAEHRLSIKSLKELKKKLQMHRMLPYGGFVINE